MIPIDTMSNPESKRTVRIFAAASFLNDFGSDIIYPVWPFFVTSVLGANMEILGLIDGLGEAVVSLSQAASGYLSDRLQKRKVFIWTGYLFGALSRLGYAFSTAWPHLIPFRILDRAGKMRGSPRDAIIADVSTQENRGRNFGLLRSMDNLGAVCGILFCLAFMHIGYQMLFLLAAVPSVISMVLVILTVRERPLHGTQLFKGLELADLGRNFRLFLALSALFALGSFSYSFLLIKASSGTSPAFAPVLYLFFTLSAALFSLPFGRLSDRIGRRAVMQIAFALWGGVCAWMLFAEGKTAMIGVFVLFGLHRAALEPVQKTLVAELAPSRYRASAMGGFQMVTGLCALPSSLMAGILWDRVSPAAPLEVSLVLTLIALILLFFVQQPRTAR
jgi:MFS family permease